MVAVVMLVSAGASSASGIQGGQHCVSRLVPLEPVGGVTQARLEPIGCFATYDQALEAGSGTAIDVSASVSPATLTDATATLLGTASSVLIGTEFDGSLYLGSSQSYFASETCSTNVIWSVANVGSEWNDRFRSGKGFGGCDTNKKFQHENFGGDVKICTPNCSEYGSLADQVTSLKWRP
jgi:hypothetical protein